MPWWVTWLPFGHLRTAPSARAASLGAGRIEDLTSPDGSPTMIGGGQETPAALPVASWGLDGAIYSSRGRRYASYNEDAAALFADRRGRIYAMALDQAGGLGGSVRGAASALAAKRVWQACRTLALEPADSDPTGILIEAIEIAHRELVERGEGEVTTAVVAVVSGEQAFVVNSGDSGAVLFGRNGKLKARTEMQEFDGPNLGCLRHAVGLEPEGCAAEVYRWPFEPGDWLVLGSDGLLDSGLVERELGSILRDADTAEDAVNHICTLILRRMSFLRAKPDNLTVVALKKQFD